MRGDCRGHFMSANEQEALCNHIINTEGTHIAEIKKIKGRWKSESFFNELIWINIINTVRSQIVCDFMPQRQIITNIHFFFMISADITDNFFTIQIQH